MKLDELGLKPDGKWHHVVINYQLIDQVQITDESPIIPIHKTEIYIDGQLKHTKINGDGGSVEWWQKWFE